MYTNNKRGLSSILKVLYFGLVGSNCIVFGMDNISEQQESFIVKQIQTASNNIKQKISEVAHTNISQLDFLKIIKRCSYIQYSEQQNIATSCLQAVCKCKSPIICCFRGTNLLRIFSEAKDSAGVKESALNTRLQCFTKCIALNNDVFAKCIALNNDVKEALKNYMKKVLQNYMIELITSGYQTTEHKTIRYARLENLKAVTKLISFIQHFKDMELTTTCRSQEELEEYKNLLQENKKLARLLFTVNRDLFKKIGKFSFKQHIERYK